MRAYRARQGAFWARARLFAAAFAVVGAVAGAVVCMNTMTGGQVAPAQGVAHCQREYGHAAGQAPHWQQICQP